MKELEKGQKVMKEFFFKFEVNLWELKNIFNIKTEILKWDIRKYLLFLK